MFRTKARAWTLYNTMKMTSVLRFFYENYCDKFLYRVHTIEGRLLGRVALALDNYSFICMMER